MDSIKKQKPAIEFVTVFLTTEDNQNFRPLFKWNNSLINLAKEKPHAKEVLRCMLRDAIMSFLEVCEEKKEIVINDDKLNRRI
jgi:hypothetical protein